ncbi:peptidylprolyl isomerase [Pseudomonas aeruginosa]
MVRDEVHVRHILLKPSEIAAKRRREAGAEAVRAHPVRGRLRRTGEELLEDPGSALNGGDLNWIDPEALVPEFRQVMNDTPQGELSKPFRSQFGWHILQVLGRRATDSSEKFREQQAVSVLRNRKYDEELQAWLRQIRDEAYVEIKQ